MFNAVYQGRQELRWCGTAESSSEPPGVCLAIAVKPNVDKTFIAVGVLLLGVLIYGSLRWWLHVLGVRQHKLEEIIAERNVLIREREKQLQEHNEQLQQRLGERTRLLQNIEERYRELYTYNPTMYFTVDARGMVLSVNQFGAEHLGYTDAELVGQSVLKVFLEEDHLRVQQQLAECVQNLHQVHEFELRKTRKDGSILWVKEYARGVPNPGARFTC